MLTIANWFLDNRVHKTLPEISEMEYRAAVVLIGGGLMLMMGILVLGFFMAAFNIRPWEQRR